MNRRPFLRAGIAAALLVQAAAPVQGRTLAEIWRTGELRICVAGSSAEYYRINGEDFARELGVRPRTTTLQSWDHQFHNAEGATVMDGQYEPALLVNGQCDLYPNDLHMTAWRRQKMNLVPYFMTRSVVVSRPDLRNTLRKPEDLAGRVAAVQAGTAYETWLREFNTSLPKDRSIAIETAPTAQSLRRVAERRADFSVIAAESAFRWIRDDMQNLDLLFTVGETTEVGWAISRDAADLRDALDRYFAASRRIGSRLDLSWRRNYGISLVEYQLFSAPFDPQAQLRTLWAQWGIPLASAVAGIVLAMLFWARRMRREVAHHRIDAEALRQSQASMALEADRKKAVSELLLALQQTETLEAFAQAVLREFARHLPVGQGLFATVHPLSGVRAEAHYAGSGTTAAQTLGAFPTTAGLLGRCIATGQTVVVDQPGEDYLRIQSGLGNCAPAGILVLPVKRSGAVVALIELATTQALTPNGFQLLDELIPIVSVSLERFQHGAEPGTHEAPASMAPGPQMALQP